MIHVIVNIFVAQIIKVVIIPQLLKVLDVKITYFVGKLPFSCYNLIVEQVVIIGGGLAGVEAAFSCGKRIKVKLYEMRPGVMTPAHHSAKLGELVCSNSLKSKELTNACGLLKKKWKYIIH